MSVKYNKPLIAGTDTHNLNKYKANERDFFVTYEYSFNIDVNVNTILSSNVQLEHLIFSTESGEISIIK